jgi:hypothetical protein
VKEIVSIEQQSSPGSNAGGIVRFAKHLPRIHAFFF